MSIESAPTGDVSPRADLVSAALWMAFGAAIAVGSWRMDRLENLHINPYEVPGLVPGLLGCAVLLLGVLLAVRSIRRGALRPAAVEPRSSVGLAGWAIAAMLLYALVLVGHGIPFWLATGVFVAAFIFIFDAQRQRELGRTSARRALLAAICGVTTSLVVTLVFQEIFYVRLP